MLGPGDLRVSLDLPAQNPPGRGEHPKFYAAVSKLVAAAKNSKIPLLVPSYRANPDTIEWLRDFKLIMTSIDILNLVKGQRQDLALIKEALYGYQNGF